MPSQTSCCSTGERPGTASGTGSRAAPRSAPLHPAALTAGGSRAADGNLLDPITSAQREAGQLEDRRGPTEHEQGEQHARHRRPDRQPSPAGAADDTQRSQRRAGKPRDVEAGGAVGSAIASTANAELANRRETRQRRSGAQPAPAPPAPRRIGSDTSTEATEPGTARHPDEPEREGRAIGSARCRRTGDRRAQAAPVPLHRDGAPELPVSDRAASTRAAPAAGSLAPARFPPRHPG
jgi:hypothetical protein